MANKSYRSALSDAKQELARYLTKRQEIDHQVARLTAVITQLQHLCAEQDRTGFWNNIERVVKTDLKMGITQTVRVLLKETALPMTASDLKTGIEARKYDLSRFQNAMAVIHTVLNRLVKSGEVKVIAQRYGKKAYQWVSTTEKLLSELQETDQPAARQRDGGKESK